MKTFAIAFSVAGLLVFVTLHPAEPDDQGVARLIEQLGSAKHTKREEAEAALLALKAIHARLRKACRSTDLETRTRARRIVSVFEGRTVARALARGDRLADEGRFDEAIEYAVRWGGHDPTGKNLVPLAALARRLRESEARRFDWIDPKGRWTASLHIEKRLEARPGDLSFFSSDKPLHIDLDEKHSVSLRAPGLHVVRRQAAQVFAASSGRANFDCMRCQNVVVFACDSVTLPKVNYAIIVADGDVEVKGGELFCVLIIARGNVSLAGAGRIHNTVVLAGGAVEHPKIEESQRRYNTLLVRENDLSGLGVIKFFDPKSAGVEVGPGPIGVRVERLRPGTPFAKALRVGDVVSTIDGSETPSPEIFRRALRRALANVGSDMALAVRRQGKSLQVEVPVEP